MDTGADEWSSNESGWTAYIASPDHKDNRDDDDDDDNEDEENEEDRSINKREKVKQDVDSDDSMASDASSGPSDRYRRHGLVHAGNKNERKHSRQQEVKKQHDHEKVKAGKDKADSAARSKKR